MQDLEKTLVDNEIPDFDEWEEDTYADLKPVLGEERYAEYDEEFETWAVFGATSGFCYMQGSEEEAVEAAK